MLTRTEEACRDTIIKETISQATNLSKNAHCDIAQALHLMGVGGDVRREVLRACGELSNETDMTVTGEAAAEKGANKATGKILYTSDLHFGHKNVILFDHRPFLDVDEMDRTLIALWNMRVQKDDTVYILGDFCYKSSRAPEWYLRQLKGHKILVIGNHDGSTLDNPKAMHYFEDAKPMMHVIDGDRQVQLCHFPIAEWNGEGHGSWHVYGHIHNRKAAAYEYMRTKDRALNAGCMLNGFAPVSFDELIRNNKRFQGDSYREACV